MIRVYYNTGFNSIDKPLTRDVLELANHRDYPDTRPGRPQWDQLTEIRINDTFENLQLADYVRIGDAESLSYYQCIPESIAQNTTLLHLKFDACLSLGGIGALEWAGWQTRGHIPKSEDDFLNWTAPEPWAPASPLVVRQLEMVANGNSNSDPVTAIQTTIDLAALARGNDNEAEVIKGIVSGETEPEMFFPKITTRADSTIYAIEDIPTGNIYGFTIPNLSAYDTTNANVMKALTKLYSAGQLELQASYTVPGKWIQSAQKFDTGRYTTIQGYAQITDCVNFDFAQSISGYTPRNKKVLYTYRDYTLLSQGSGASSTKTIEEVYNDSGHVIVWLWADPCSIGKPYARFLLRNPIGGSQLQYMDAVPGLQWLTSQLTIEGASGSAWNNIQAAFNRAQLDRDRAQAGMNQTYNSNAAVIRATTERAVAPFQIAAGAAQTIGAIASGDIVGGMQKGIGLGIDMINAGNSARLNELAMAQQRGNWAFEQAAMNQRRNEMGIQALQANTQHPLVLFTPEQNLAAYGLDDFYLYETVKQANDAAAEDRFYDLYGYSGINRPLTKQTFEARRYYTYVEATGVSVNIADVPYSSGQYTMRIPKRIADLAIAEINAGVRVWKVLPDINAYSTIND